MTLLLLAALGALAAPLVRQPYLQRTTTEQTTVRWSTLLPSTGQVRYGTDPNNLSSSATSLSWSNDTEHQAVLAGLSPDTVYYYEVVSDGGVVAGGPDWFVRTSPPVGSRGSFRAWVVGDSGTGLLRQYEVRDAMLAHVGRDVPDLYLHVGDMAYGEGTWLQFTTNFFLPYQGILRNTTVWPAMGNHEGKSADSDTQSGPYYDGYVLPTGGEAGGVASGTEAYYSFDYANAHFIVLDSHDSDRASDGAMATWLEADLSATTQEWIVAYWHHPAYSKGTHDSDVETACVEMRENLLPILEAGGVDLVLAGHSHIYERSYLLDGSYETPSTTQGVLDWGNGVPGGDGPYAKAPAGVANDGALYVVAGHGGTGTGGVGGHPVMYFSESRNGSLVMDFQENRLDIANVRWDGVVSDRVALVKGDGLVIVAPNGGEGLLPGASAPITWDTVGAIDAVDVAYSCDDGATWEAVAEDLPNTGRYDWDVPLVQSADVLVQVSDASDPAVRDRSNGRLGLGGDGVDAIAWGAEWRYLDSGAEPPSDWREASFDDSAWASGPAQLGYGEGDQATLLDDQDPNVPSVYFRRVIDLPEAVTDALLEVIYDDGIIVWINGYKVLSENVFFEGHSSWATSTSDDNAYGQRALGGAYLNPGENVVSVMVKQAGPDSSDLSFDLHLAVDLAGGLEACDTSPPDPVDTGGDDTADSGDTGADDTGGNDTGLTGDDTGGGEGPEGCGCATGGTQGWLGLLPVLALLARRRRRGR